MTAEEIGQIRREFKPGMERIVAGIVVGLLLIGGGCALIFLVASGVAESGGNLPVFKEGRGWSWAAAGLMSVIGLGLITGGFILIWWVLSLLTFRVHVGENGIAVLRKKAVQVIGWDDIASVEETHLYQSPPIIKSAARHLLPKAKSKHFVVKMRQGNPLRFDADSIRGPSQLAKMIREATEPRNIPWEIVERYG
jgi:hypothetical protein